MSSSDPINILILTGSGQNRKGIGQLFFESLTRKRKDIVFISYVRPPFLINSSKKNYFSKKLYSLCNNIILRSSIAQSIRIYIYRKYILKKDVRKILYAVDNNNVEAVWLATSSIELILIADCLHYSGKKIKTTVWDVPEYLCQRAKLSERLTAKLMESFKDVLMHSSSVSVVSHAMKKMYAERYGVNSIVIKHGIKPVISRKEKTNKKVLRVVFSGSLYSKAEWNSFVCALNECGWYISDRKVELYFLGRYPVTGAVKCDNIKFLGEKTFEESMQIISGMDIGYLPYWFSDKFRLVAQTSFPGKMSAYAAAGVAVFNHSPEYTEIAEFLSKYPFGVTCSSLDSKVIIADINRLTTYLSEPECRKARKSAMNDELGELVMQERFSLFIK